MKYIPVERDAVGAIIPYVHYNVQKSIYILADRNLVEESIETVFDMEVLPSTFIPVGVTGKPRVVEAVPASSYYTMLSQVANSMSGTFTLDRNEAGLIQVITLVHDGLVQIHGRTAFVNPDCLMEDDAYIPYAMGTDFIELRRMMATNPINF